MLLFDISQEAYMKQFFVVFCFVCVMFVSSLSGQEKPKFVVAFSEQEAILLVNQLLSGVNPETPGNEYFTPLMKEKIRWIYEGVATHRIILRCVDTSKDSSGWSRLVLMSATYSHGLPLVQISGNRVLEMVRLQQRVAHGFNQMQKNGFALALVHEAVHLEKPQTFFVKGRTEAESFDEELRAYRKVDSLAVAELLRMKQPLDDDYLIMHQIFKSCGTSISCPAFMNYYLEKRRR